VIHRILVVGATLELEETLSESTDPSRFQITSVEDAEQALHLFLKYGAIAVVVNLDRHFEMHLRLIHRLRTLRRRDAHVLAVASQSTPEMLCRVLDAGADDFMTYPVHSSEITQRVHWALAMSNMPRKRPVAHSH
jgi:DNA-binding response OmpR family regulator